MTDYTGRRDNRGGTTTHSKADALTEREFELLLRGARRLDGTDGLEAETAVLVAGRLGLRAGELGHLRTDWINPRMGRIDIPEHEPCEKGRHGGPCGYCRQHAKQAAEYHEGLSVDQALEQRWTPKTEAAARSVPFDFSARVELALERFADEYDGWPLSAQGVYRRVTSAADAADGLDPDDVRPHGLRATAASYHAARGLETLPLQSLFGWKNLSTAEKYIATSSENTQRALNSIHSR